MIVFLDLDGVLTCTRSARKYNSYDKFDEECVRALNHITEMTGAGTGS